MIHRVELSPQSINMLRMRELDMNILLIAWELILDNQRKNVISKWGLSICRKEICTKK